MKLTWIGNHFKDKFLLNIARWYDDRHARSCWADNVMWALGFRDELSSESGESCMQDACDEGSCYCGKWMRGDWRERFDELRELGAVNE